MPELPLLTTEAPPSPERFKVPKHDVAIAFGQGPVIDVETKDKAEKIGASQAEINSWGKTTAVAMGYLYLKGEMREVVWSGGKTGGRTYQSEAQLMSQTERDVFGDIIPEDSEHLDDESPNTLANMENTFNRLDRLTSDAIQNGKIRRFDKHLMVASDFHIARIRTLGILYNLGDFEVLSSEQVLRVMLTDHELVTDDIILKTAKTLIDGWEGTDASEARRDIENWLDRRIDPANIDLNRSREGDYQSFIGGGKTLEEHRQGIGFTPFEQAQGEERKDAMSRRRNEDMFNEGLVRFPANWLGFISRIENDDRLRGILFNLHSWNPGFLNELAIGIDIQSPLAILRMDHDALDRLRTKLEPYRDKPYRKFVSLYHETYDSETLKHSQQLLEHRVKKK